MSALHVAVEHSRPVAANILLNECGVSASVREKDGMTALDLAAALGRADMIKVLLKGGSFLTPIAFFGSDCLIVNSSVLCWGGEQACLLGRYQAIIMGKWGGKNPELPYFQTGVCCRHSQQIKLQVDVVPKPSLCLLSRLCPHVAVVGGVPVEPQNFEKSVTPLHYAARSGQTDCVRLLLEAKATAGHCWNENGRVTPLFLAASEGHCCVIKVLAPRLCPRQINMQQMTSKHTPLTAAVAGRHHKAVQAVRRALD